MPFQRGQDVAPAVVAGREVGTQRQGAIETVKSFLGPSGVVQCVSEVVVRFHIPCVLSDGTLEAGNRFVQPTLTFEDDTQIAVAGRVGRVQPERLGDMPGGVLVPV